MTDFRLLPPRSRTSHQNGGRCWSRERVAAPPCNPRSMEGMTLLELLVVMVILGLLATLGSIQILGYLDRAKADAAELQVRELTVAVDLFRMDVGRPPTTEEGLSALLTAPQDADGWRGPYLKGRGLLRDPWGVAYHYESPGSHGDYDVFSFGSDRRSGGTDDAADVANWSLD